MRALIVDDEPLARKRLRDLLAEQPDVQVVGEAGEGRAALAAVRRRRPDVVLLDIQMPGMDGFEVAAQLAGPDSPALVFVTAHEEHALRAFDASAVDYLLKPFDAQRLSRALARVRRQRAAGESGGAELNALLRRLAEGAEPPQRLLVRQEQRWTLLRAKDIDWIEAAGKYVRLHRGPEVLLLRESIGRLVERLAATGFARIHRSTIVNLDRVVELEPAFHGDMSVALQDGTRLTLSRAYRAALEQRLGRA